MKQASRSSTVTKARKDGSRTVLGERLLGAASDGNARKVQQLIERGADPNFQDSERMTALHHAVCGFAGTDVIRQLLAGGAKVDARCSLGSTPLLMAVHDEKLDIVRVLVEHGADVNARNHDEDTPLTNAAIWGERRCVVYLLAQGADPLLPAGGYTAAELARQHGYDDIAAAIDSVREALAR